MSVSLWRYSEMCEGRPCPGECDKCNFDPAAAKCHICKWLDSDGNCLHEERDECYWGDNKYWEKKTVPEGTA